MQGANCVDEQRRGILAWPLSSVFGGARPGDSDRRIVTGEDKSGAASVLFDGSPPVSFELNGTVITRLWESGPLPVQLPIVEDAALTAGNAYREGFVGSSLYFADFPAATGATQIPLHKQDSLDYIAVMFGQVNLLLPDRSLPLKAGDVLIQGGNLHTWENRSGEPARILVVVLTAERDA